MAERIRSLVGLTLGLTVLFHAGEVWAPFHLLVIEEVFFGTEDCPDAQYVELRTIAFGQTLVNNQRVTTQVADGTAAPDFGRFTKNLPNANAGAHMIMGTPAAAALFGITLDAVVTGRLVEQDGRVCFGLFGPPPAPVDCVAYGDYTGNNGTHGSPASAPVLGMALVRQSETNNNADDFVLGDPLPENNDAEVGTIGQCPPPEPTATATIAVEPTPTSTIGIDACTGDCNGDFTVTVDEIIQGVNIALGSSPVDGCPPFDADASGTVTVDEIVAAVNNALNGCGA